MIRLRALQALPLLFAAVPGSFHGCSRPGPAPVASAAAHPTPAAKVVMTDVTRQAGIRFRHNTGAFGRKYYPETMGAGCAFFDYDNDGWPDLLFVNGRDWPDAPRRRKTTSRLYRNRRDGTFEDVTRRSGLDAEIYGIGCAANDFDNDGYTDVYITCATGPSHLFHNQGEGTFKDVTPAAGVDDRGQFATSALWFDYDRDGWLDLFVCNYIRWSAPANIHCALRPGVQEYCTPEAYDGIPCRLYRNLRNGRFADVTAQSGIGRAAGKSMSAALCDYNGDGWPDLVVTNDTEPTFLFRNDGKGAFTEEGLDAGVALGETGKAKAGMGVDAADAGNDGSLSILTTNFSGESLSYFTSQPGGTFVDSTALAGLGSSSLLYLGWGTFFFDYDLDGWSDIFVANGHIYPNVASYQPTISYAERPLLYRNLGNGRFEDVGGSAGSGLAPIVARGAAFADFDHDGDPDIAINANGSAARLIRNDGGNRNRWLSLRLQGVRSNRDAVGTVVRVTAGGISRTQMVRGGSSYASQSDRPLIFGMGALRQADTVEIRWPSGEIERVRDVPAGQRLLLREGTARPEHLP